MDFQMRAADFLPNMAFAFSLLSDSWGPVLQHLQCEAERARKWNTGDEELTGNAHLPLPSLHLSPIGVNGNLWVDRF
jgi:hypothetical protein